jgi:murein L,D-transpeptidase YafK
MRTIGAAACVLLAATAGAFRLRSENFRRTPLPRRLHQPRIVVHKTKRVLQLYSGETLVRTYTIALGLSPIEDKEREGDRRTPEGSYRVVAKNANSQWYRSLTLNYPNSKDAKRGLRDRLITQRQYNQIVRADRERRTPPMETPLGGKILIHGGGTGSDWTWGCVAMDNPDLLELFRVVPIGTPVRIEH